MPSPAHRFWGLVYAKSGLAIMWVFWACFGLFLASPPWAVRNWPFPTVDHGGLALGEVASVAVDIALIALFGLQHSVMARPFFKQRVLGAMPAAFVRVTFVHAANIALFALILLWQPIPLILWDLPGPFREVTWLVFAGGWILLLFGALSFGIYDLLGITQMRAWSDGAPTPSPRLKTGMLYHVFRHPMYVGVLLAMWATPRMTVGHALLAAGMSMYVLIAMRYEERDLEVTFGRAYGRWGKRPILAGMPAEAEPTLLRSRSS